MDLFGDLPEPGKCFVKTYSAGLKMLLVKLAALE
jgi:hypothetical protein